MAKSKSPYSASFTGAAFMFAEFNAILPLLMDENIDSNIKAEIVERKHLQVNTEVAASRVLSEFKKRYTAMPERFWTWYITLGEPAQKAALLYVILKTYRLLFDFHIGVTIRKWNSAERTATANDLLSAYYDIAAKDEFVDSWSDLTRKKIISSYQTILCQAGMMDRATAQLRPIHLAPQDYSWYIQNGEAWFLEACLLYPYEIEDIKASI
jgi:hypothetical protein